MNGYDSKGLFITSSFLVITGLLYLAYLNYQSGHALLAICFAALLTGLFLEIGTVTKKWTTVWILVLCSCLCTLLFFVPGDDLDQATRVQYWPLAFCFFFIIMITVVFERMFIPRLNEGVVMLQSVGLAYWIIDIRVWEWESIILKGVVLSPLIMAAFSVFHAFSYRKLNRNLRLALSMWSALLMLAFATDNFWGLIFGLPVNEVSGWANSSVFILKYFLTGASIIYVVESLLLFIPRDDEERPGRTIDLVKLHVERFSAEQVHRSHSAFALIFAASAFVLNHQLQLVPRQIAIWSVFVVFPLILGLYIRFVEPKVLPGNKT